MSGRADGSILRAIRQDGQNAISNRDLSPGISEGEPKMNNMTSRDLSKAAPSDPTASDDKRAQTHPLTNEEKLETGIEDSMDASDPPSVTAPGEDGRPHPSSGFREKSCPTEPSAKS